MRTTLRTLLVGWLSAAMMLIGFPAHAGMIGTEQAVSVDARADHLATVERFMTRDDVRAQLETWGVEPATATDRVASLSDAELQQMAMNIESQPAGGDALAVIGIVFVVLLILELVGVTNIFSSF
ncbi:MAG: PA2779 family protein [Panacagrimonas sp.]